MSLKVYIAAPYQMRDEALVLMFLLKDEGIGCTSSWLTEAAEDDSAEAAKRDLAGIDRCDAFVAMNPERYRNAGTGGRHVEYGYAFALGKPLLLFGVVSNVFHRLSEAVVVDGTAQLVLRLNSLKVTQGVRSTAQIQ